MIASPSKLLLRTALLAAVLPLGGSLASGPSWWSDRGVIARDQNGQPRAADDFHLLNQGQLKHLATQAAAEFELRLPGGAGTQVWELVNSWTSPATPQEDYTTLNVGQLKNVAKLFYDRLADVGYAEPPKQPGQKYIWTPSTLDDDDFRYANIGQAKRLFSFEFVTDTDGDGVPDWRERANGTNPNVPGDALQELLQDDDGDGISNGDEIAQGTNPRNRDTDGDGFWDGADADPNDPQVQLASVPGDTTSPTITLTHPVIAP